MPLLSAGSQGSEQAILSIKGREVLALKIAGAGSSFVMYIVLARALGVSEYGILIYALTWLNVILLVGKFGMDVTVVRFLPAYIENGDWARARGVLRFGHLVVALATGGLAIAGLLLAYAGFLPGEGSSSAFAIGLVSLPLLALSALRQAALRALRAFVLAEIPDGLMRPWFLIAAVALAWTLAERLSASHAMLAYLLVNAMVLAIGSVWFLRALPVPLAGAPLASDSHAWFTVSLHVTLLMGAFQLLNQIDILMLGFLADAADVARYSAASRMAGFVSFGIIGLSSVAGPLMSASAARGDLLNLAKVVKSGTRRGFAIAVAASLVFAIFGSFILGLFGSDFRPAYPALLILVLGQLVNAFWGLGSSVMMMTGRQGQLVSLMIGALVLNAGLNWLLIPQWGIVGAATATAASTIAWSGALFLYCLKALRLQVSVL